MTAMPLLSALIVNYNTADLTRDCVASLRAQQLAHVDGTPAELEIIVVDNASTDCSAAADDSVSDATATKSAARGAKKWTLIFPCLNRAK